MALLHRAHWRLLFLLAALKMAVRDIHVGLVMKPIAGGAPDDDATDSGDDGADASEADDDTEDDHDSDEGDSDDTEDDPDKIDSDEAWKTKSRKWERKYSRQESRATKAERELEKEREQREKREEAEKSEHQKELDKVRNEVESKAAKERRQDRLEVSVTRLASRKVKLGDADDAEEVRFADPEDALLHIERAISNGEIDEEDIFDKDGKVDSDALKKEIVDLLERKPHLRESTGSERGRKTERKGDPDLGKGDPADSSLESMSVEDHVKRKYAAKK